MKVNRGLTEMKKLMSSCVWIYCCICILDKLALKQVLLSKYQILYNVKFTIVPQFEVDNKFSSKK